MRAWIGKTLRRYMDMSISAKLFVGYLIIVLVPTLLLSTAIYQLNYRNMQAQYAANERHALDLARHGFDNQIAQADNLIDVLASNISVKRYLSGFYGSEAEAIYAYMGSIQPFIQYVTGLESYFTDVKIYSYETKNVLPFTSIRHASELALPDALVHSVNTSFDGVWTAEPGEGLPVLHYHRPVFNADYSRVLGFVRVRANAALLFDSFSALSNVSFYGEEGAFLFRFEQGGPRFDPPPGKSADAETFLLSQLKISGEQRHVHHSALQAGSLLLLAVLLALCLVLTALYYALVRLAVKHIVALNRHIAQSDPHGLTPLAIKVYKDEPGQLVTSFNYMIDRVNALIHEVYRSRLKQKDAEHYALQAQIEPHFLFNILENIRMEALSGHGARAAGMIQLLGSYMRYNLKRGTALVPLLDELTHAKNYLAIHKMRLGDRLDSKIACQMEIEDAACPRFTLQPILENALQHGASGAQPILIQADIQNGSGLGRPGDVVVSIRDNGRGISAEQLESIRLALRMPDRSMESEAHVGLYNVSQRLEALWGEAYRLSIDSLPGEGTTVRVYIKTAEPPHKEDEADENFDRG